LAGPVFAAAVILDPTKPIDGLTDSKLLSQKKRELLADQIRISATAWAVARAEVHEIDTINILQASLLAMQRAVNALSIKPELALIDGNKCPDLFCQAKAIIGGDKIMPAISAASILAKVARDAEMLMLDEQYPDYGFAKHKGYGTKQHLAALKAWGASPIHRHSFAPVKACIS
jgi:ribonuclease HII